MDIELSVPYVAPSRAITIEPTWLVSALPRGAGCYAWVPIAVFGPNGLKAAEKLAAALSGTGADDPFAIKITAIPSGVVYDVYPLNSGSLGAQCYGWPYAEQAPYKNQSGRVEPTEVNE